MGNYIANKYRNYADNQTMNMIYYNTALNNYKNNGETYCLKLDRILDSENQIYIGIGERKQKNDNLQVIRIGDYTNKYYRLLQFTESENKLKYEFENEIILTLNKDDDDIKLELIFLNNKNISTKINPLVINNFRPIRLASKEFDKIYDLFADIRCRIPEGNPRK